MAKRPPYKVTVRGPIPPDIGDRIAEIWAEGVKARIAKEGSSPAGKPPAEPPEDKADQ